MKSHLLLAAVFAVGLTSTQAAWTTLALPDTTSWGNTAMGHLADGHFVYGHNGSMIRQDTFGSNAATPFTNAPSGDYAYLTSKYFGSGAWGGGPVASYNSGNTSTTFTTIGSYQSYAALHYGASGMLLVGTNGGNSDLGYLTDGNAYTTLIDNVSTYSGGFAFDGAGNLFIADDDNLNIYRFTSAQIASAVAGTTLTMGDGTLIANLGVSGSLAFDSIQNRLYASGWQSNGIQFFDLDDSTFGNIVPGLANPNYQVMTFSDGANNYVGWLNRSGWNGGDTVTYGYDLAANVVPEPSSAAFLFFGLASLAALRRRRRAHKL